MRQAPKIADITARIAGECLAVRLRRLNREVTALYDEALRPLGLKTSQLNMLVMISAAIRLRLRLTVVFSRCRYSPNRA